LVPKRDKGEDQVRKSARKAEARKAYAEMLAKLPIDPDSKTIHPEPKGDLKKSLGYERSTPRCETCKFMKEPMTIIHKSTTKLPVVQVPPVCRRGKFYTRAGALCDHWVSHAGQFLIPDDESVAALMRSAKPHLEQHIKAMSK
jgi:hypothetical protein